MTPHPHSEVLRAIADGVPLSEFEMNNSSSCIWLNLDDYRSLVFSEEYTIRRKPQYIIVNSFKVPKPLDVLPNSAVALFVPMVSDQMFMYTGTNSDSPWCGTMFSRGIIHPTKEAAIAHAKAMLGIDPEYFK